MSTLTRWNAGTFQRGPFSGDPRRVIHMCSDLHLYKVRFDFSDTREKQRAGTFQRSSARRRIAMQTIDAYEVRAPHRSWWVWHCPSCEHWHWDEPDPGPYPEACDINVESYTPDGYTLQLVGIVEQNTFVRTDAPTTLYRLWSSSHDLLYVGIAGNPGRRFEQHQTDKPWWGAVAAITLEHFPNRRAAQDAEAIAIRREQPMHNRVRYLSTESA